MNNDLLRNTKWFLAGTLLIPATLLHAASGILDFSAYEKWLESPPEILVIEKLNETTLDLLHQQLLLAEAVLFPGDPDIPDETDIRIASIARRLETLKANFPEPLGHGYHRNEWNVTLLRRSGSTDSLDYAPGSDYTSDWNRHQDYQRRFSTITVTNISSAVKNLRVRIGRDLRDAAVNAQPNTRGGRKGRVNYEWLKHLDRYLDQFERLGNELAMLRSTEKPDPVAAWNEFSNKDLHILHQILASKIISRHQLDDQGKFTTPRGTELLIYFKIKNRGFYYPEKGEHHFRLFNLEP